MPPLKKKKRRLNRWVAAACTVVVLGFGYKAWQAKSAAADKKPEVQTAEVERGNVRQTASATGKLQAFTLIDVKSKAGGKVIKMAVEEGTRVKRGQLIAIIDRTDVSAIYRQAEADANAAKSAVDQSRADLAQQRASLGPQINQAGESVSAAQARLAQAQESLKLQSDTNGPAIRQASEAVNSSKARLAQAKESLDLQRKTSETAVAAAQSGVEAAQSRLEQAKTQAKTQPELTQLQIAQAQASVSSAEANVASAQENLKLLQSASQPQATARAQADVSSAKSDLSIAELNLRRFQGLLDKGFVAKSQVDSTKNTVDLAKSRLQTSQAVLDTLKEQQAAEVREAKARVEQAQASVGQAKAGLSTSKANSIQDSLRQQDVETAQATWKQAQSNLQDAIANRRQVQLKQADVSAASAAVRQAEAALNSAKANTRQISLKRSDVNAAAAALRQADAALANTKTQSISSQSRAAAVEQARARLDRAQVTQQNAATNLAETRVVAPRDGVVVTKYVDEGTIIQSGTSGFSGGTAIVQMAQVDRMYVDAQVDEADIALIEPGQKVDITMDAYPNWGIGGGEGVVRKVYPQAAEEQNVTYIHVQVEVDASLVDDRLRPGMNATCDFVVASAEDALMVPNDAVKENGDVTEVTIIKDPKKPMYEKSNQETRTVETGVQGDDNVEIIKGVKEGETVVTKIIEPITADSGGGGLGGGAPRGPTGGMGGRR